MKLFTVAMLAGLFCISASAQEDKENNQGVEKCIFTAQTGGLGLWVSNELRLGNEYALRTEIGIDAYTIEIENGKDDNMMVPSISVEPRWYYNIERRSTKGKHTANNSADFVTVAVEYISGELAISQDTKHKLPEIITFIPKWGMRRAISGSNFNYELGGGVGYQGYIVNSDDIKDTNLGIDLHLRIGYTF